EELCGQVTPCSLHFQIILESPMELHRIDVEILDVNDHAPVFEKKEINIEIMESVVRGSLFSLENAHDPDVGLNTLQSYTLKPADIFSLKEFSRNTGDIRVNGILDFEKSKQYELNVKAMDNGGLTDTSKVLVEITDVNDNAPVISVISFSNPIPEDSAPETVIAMLNIKDIDFGKNGQIRCLVDSDLPFRIKSSSSNFYSLITNQFLDREKCSEYNITITATDEGFPSFSTNKTLNLKISDVNDNAPLFQHQSYTAYVLENNTPGVSIFAVTAADKDSGNNARISYFLEDDSREYIGLNVDKGTLVVRDRIDREELCAQVTPCSLHFQIILESPMELHRIDVEILDVNDHSPVFTRNEINFQISESAMPGAKFSLDNAHDPDVGMNALQRYTLNPTEYFSLKEIIGNDGLKYVEMVLQASLDREDREEHTLSLMAFDGGSPQKSGTVKITITVLDANDNAPVFSLPVYRVTMQENSPRGTYVATVAATDKDKGTNAQVTYSFSQSTGKNLDLFNIDSKTGDITVTSELDFEKSKHFQINVEATDKGGLTDSCKVVIEITDVNDNAPVIKTVIAMINVKDLDFGKNGQVKCSIDPNLPFKIQSSSSNFYSVVTDQVLDRETKPEYNITIRATDDGSPSFSTNKTLNLKI
uniref:Protocadherin 2 gamma 28 n=1 Tax=Astyanax mexicanus TaxID=7994 RepID=A0A8B9GPZ8_ASTMX